MTEKSTFDISLTFKESDAAKINEALKEIAQTIRDIQNENNMQDIFDIGLLLKRGVTSSKLLKNLFLEVKDTPKRVVADLKLLAASIESIGLLIEKRGIEAALERHKQGSRVLTAEEEQKLRERITAITEGLENLKLAKDEAFAELFQKSDPYEKLISQVENLGNILLNAQEPFDKLNGGGLQGTIEQTEQAGEAMIDFLSSFEDGALIFGYTKEELLGVGSAAGEAAEKTKDLDKNALKGVVDQAGNAEETLGTLNSTTGDLSARSEELAGAQEYMTQAVADGSAVMDNAGASAEQFGEALEQVESSGGFFDGIKQGFVDFVENVESNSELMADFFANTLTEMSQNFSDLFYNVLTGKFDNLQDLAKQTFEAILRAFLDMVAAIATRQIVISIAGAIGIGTKGASATDYLGFGKQAVGVGSDLAGMFSSGAGGAALGGGISAIGAGASAAGGASGVGASLGLTGISSVGTVPTGGAATFGLSGISSIPAAGPGFLSAALPWVGAVLAAAAIAYTFLAPLLKKTPRLDIDFDSIKTETGRRAALVSEILDEDFFTEDIAQISVKRKAGLGVGGNDRIKEIIQEKLEETIEGIQDIIAKLPTDMFRELNETLLGAEIDIDTVIAGERLLEFDAKGKKITEKFQQFIEGELPAKFFAAIRESFFEPAFRALGVSAEGTQGLIDKFMADMEAAGSREARAEVGAEFIATFNAFVDAFNIVSGNVNDSIGQTIQKEEWEYRLAA